MEQLCRYITRLALANERVQNNAVGQAVHKLKTAWRDGTTHLMMLPLRKCGGALSDGFSAPESVSVTAAMGRQRQDGRSNC